MPIVYDETSRTFTLSTANTMYQFAIGPYGYLLHTWYGERVDGQDFSYLLPNKEFIFSVCPAEAGADRTFSLDARPLEYPGCGCGDFRHSALDVQNADGSHVADLRYRRHEIRQGKYTLTGLPCFYAVPAETLSVVLSDMVSGLDVCLLYGVFADTDIITRAAIVTNRGSGDIRLFKAQSFNIDFMYEDFDLIHFPGRYAMEREFERRPVINGVVSTGSARGASSHQHNPGFIVCEKNADEDKGRCWGFNLVYSGSFRAYIERSQLGQTRVSAGLGDDGFCWLLKPGESFTAPEAVMTYSGSGLAQLSRNFHRAVRRSLCRGPHKAAARPILINNWEATYFDFTGEKLLALAREAADIGVDLFVLDDGWFGKRDDDNKALGDWMPNEAKLGGTLRELVNAINRMGLKFGIWFEPEMVNEDSDLYRAHPDWALKSPGREPLRGRGQLVLDLSRAEVREYVYRAIRAVLDSANIEYVKWDMNRSIADRCSPALPLERQGEVPHRYMLGLYALLEQLTSEYPHILFEGCSGGGGRFDLGMLRYCPQIWTSDNTDPVNRLKIQYGTSFCYPLSSIAAHVSASPCHQTGRITPFEMRGAAAMCGVFGFELDLTKASQADKDTAKQLVTRYRRHEALIREGVYYRLASPYAQCGFTAWQHAAEDGSQALVVVVVTDPQANPPLIRLRLKGLRPDAVYQCDGTAYTGAALMEAGIVLPRPHGHEPTAVLYFCNGQHRD